MAVFAYITNQPKFKLNISKIKYLDSGQTSEIAFCGRNIFVQNVKNKKMIEGIVGGQRRTAKNLIIPPLKHAEDKKS